MAAKPEPAPLEGAHELVIRRVLAAPRALVWEVWTTPAHVLQWWGPHGYTAFACTMELRPGGRWRVGMHSPAGDTMWTSGEFHEVVPPARMVMSFAWDDAGAEAPMLGGPTVVTVELGERDGQTELVLRQHGFATSASRDRHAQGWIECLERFVILL